MVRHLQDIALQRVPEFPENEIRRVEREVPRPEGRLPAERHLVKDRALVHAARQNGFRVQVLERVEHLEGGVPHLKAVPGVHLQNRHVGVEFREVLPELRIAVDRVVKHVGRVRRAGLLILREIENQPLDHDVVVVVEGEAVEHADVVPVQVREQPRGDHGLLRPLRLLGEQNVHQLVGIHRIRVAHAAVDDAEAAVREADDEAHALRGDDGLALHAGEQAADGLLAWVFERAELAALLRHHPRHAHRRHVGDVDGRPVVHVRGVAVPVDLAAVVVRKARGGEDAEIGVVFVRRRLLDPPHDRTPGALVDPFGLSEREIRDLSGRELCRAREREAAQNEPVPLAGGHFVGEENFRRLLQRFGGAHEDGDFVSLRFDPPLRDPERVRLVLRGPVRDPEEDLRRVRVGGLAGLGPVRSEGKTHSRLLFEPAPESDRGVHRVRIGVFRAQERIQRFAVFGEDDLSAALFHIRPILRSDLRAFPFPLRVRFRAAAPEESGEDRQEEKEFQSFRFHFIRVGSLPRPA